ncbi:hypothetical protein HanXRQr2_Chr10g0439131 [Helianthus annuus]|uniref:Uncharacterized protein n=1 Tax=Helianthus annuus TaxID=4232 RepID=A0A9K3HXP1_HELAN|nr:hypothetical protein HanXRQr2_Chr10g0439131 [Helianthus annuus]
MLNIKWVKSALRSIHLGHPVRLPAKKCVHNFNYGFSYQVKKILYGINPILL